MVVVVFSLFQPSERYVGYFIVILIYISLMVLNIFHMVFSHVCVSMTSSIKCLFTSFVHFPLDLCLITANLQEFLK